MTAHLCPLYNKPLSQLQEYKYVHRTQAPYNFQCGDFLPHLSLSENIISISSVQTHLLFNENIISITSVQTE